MSLSHYKGVQEKKYNRLIKKLSFIGFLFLISAIHLILSDYEFMNRHIKGYEITYPIFILINIITCYTIYSYFRIKKWKITTCSLLEKKFENYTFDGDITNIYAEVYYSYYVNNKRYYSNIVSYGGIFSSSQSHIMAVISTYEFGDKIECYYNPKNHSQSVLINKFFYIDVILLFSISLVCLLLCFL